MPLPNDGACPWSYALELMFRDYPGEIWVARKDSPMIIGIADGETYVASDVPAILKYTRNVYYIGNLEFAKLTPGEAHFYDLNGDEIEKQTTEIKWDAEAAEKAGFEHFMMKEIHEQPKAVQDTLNSVIRDGKIDLSSVEITEDEIKNFEQIYIVACGSAWHVGMAAQYVLEDMADIPVRVELASEFRYRKMPVNQKALVIVVSQSGETADTLAALRLAKEKGITTLAVVNVVGSSIAREADKVFYTLAGPGNLRSYNKSIQRTAGSDVLFGRPVCQGQRKNHGRTVQLLYFRTADYSGKDAEDSGR